MKINQRLNFTISTKRGFTLIELMITIVIIGILLSIAIPNYSAQVAKSRRADAAQTMLKIAGWLERFYTENNGYDLPPPTASGQTPAIPIGLKQSPNTGDTFYLLSLKVQIPDGSKRATQYLITATPTGAMANDECGALTLDSSQIKNIEGRSGGRVKDLAADMKFCWGR